jgi:hypothetical protein
MTAAALIVACGAIPSHSSTTSSSDPSPPTAAKVLEPWHPPHGGAKCVTDWNCSLGGSCLDGKCVCDPWFTGLNCTYLNLQRAKPDAGLQVDGFHSWGGHASLDKASGKWFGYFSFMVRHCNLSTSTYTHTLHACLIPFTSSHSCHVLQSTTDSMCDPLPCVHVASWSSSSTAIPRLSPHDLVPTTAACANHWRHTSRRFGVGVRTWQILGRPILGLYLRLRPKWTGHTHSMGTTTPARWLLVRRR